MTDDDTQYVINSNRAYGTGPYELDAFRNLLLQYSAHKIPETLDITIYEVRGLKDIHPNGVNADEVLSEETLHIEGEKAKEAVEMLNGATIKAETVLAEA